MHEFLKGVAEQTTAFVVGWGTLSLVIAGIAQGKNRSGLAWWFWASLFGPVALFFLVLAEKKKYSDSEDTK